MNEKTNIKLTLSIYGDDFNAEKLNETIGVQNSSWHKKGEVIPHRPKLKWKETDWSFNVVDVETLFLTDVTDILVNTIKNKTNILKEYMDKFELEAKIFIVLDIVGDEIPALFFNKPFLQLVNKLNAEVDIDLYN